ncbi:AarF/ABC1/UbiB kinase family protein [Paracoccus sp. 1_MG-2023]|uniref:ABC1 kinase family protein n=1 Tax=unclassified Paracoccus (in: a-proteobacteria) TaxID=2688777 RepID=UPI001C08ABC6|nr:MULTISPECIES: AarF/ABC1/UbiB kinase family protein [unclassified Paracoccus (in: a-proteobacteria)]MBU2957781.1 AarF/ABC1/UbiB kinase family protein [Paracoccus sp. C2R09]MDO6667371.1 AarF/ABC1/UbiB kinase family protein [Paracoccus sp. 1_MG-2023]
MSDDPRSRPVPTGRLSRMARIGGLAGGMGARAVAQGLRDLGKGRRPSASDLFLTPANALRMTDQLSRMRGAAMKLGQLISMDAGAVLPPELAEVMARLRADADHMPPKQLRAQLDAAWGQGWIHRFDRFETRPIAAASIGQVHRARLKDGRDLAIKVQYPGVAGSIDSDIANLGLLLRMPGVTPAGIDLPVLMAEARTQLRQEADYLQEAEAMRAYARHLGDDPGFMLPRPVEELTTSSVLAMDFIDSQPIEVLADAPQETRDRVGHRLAQLVTKELFLFDHMQTDPNFANFRWHPKSERIVLLDFGATRGFRPEVAPQYLAMLRAGLSGDRDAIAAAAVDIGYFRDRTAPDHQAALLDMMQIAFAPLRQGGVFDVATTQIPQQIADLALDLARSRAAAEMPPPDILFLHRKLGGLYLLLARLHARIDLDLLFDPATLQAMIDRR